MKQVSIEQYRCTQCAKEWQWCIGPISCQFCGSFYVEWLSYKDGKFTQIKPKQHQKRKKRKRNAKH